MNGQGPQLLADIGGTNARFALQRPGGGPDRYRVLKTGDYPGPAAAIRAYLAETGCDAPDRAAIAVAAPIIGDRVEFTNSRWSFSVGAVRDALGLRQLSVLNDFEALAWCLPVLDETDSRKIGRGDAATGCPMAVLGPGTGLGVACLVPPPRPTKGGPHGTHTAIATEGGHVTLAAVTAREAEVIAVLRGRHGHVSAERILSGPGLANIYLALAEIDGAPLDRTPTPGAITDRARNGSDPRAGEAVALFAALAGQFAGDVALMFGARGGVYIAGGVVPKLGPVFDWPLFRRRFEDKGRFRKWLARVPTYLILHPQPAMLGLAHYLDERGPDDQTGTELRS